LLLTGAQTGFHIAQTFAKSQLAKSHAQKLIPAGEAFDFVVSVVASDAAAKLLWVDQVGELGENDFSSVHPGSLAKSLLDANRTKLSNRSHPIPRTKTLSTLRETGARSFNTRTVVIYEQLPANNLRSSICACAGLMA
jgi:hypothetical protein